MEFTKRLVDRDGHWLKVARSGGFSLASSGVGRVSITEEHLWLALGTDFTRSLERLVAPIDFSG